jgi:hypothetical protein
LQGFFKRSTVVQGFITYEERTCFTGIQDGARTISLASVLAEAAGVVLCLMVTTLAPGMFRYQCTLVCMYVVVVGPISNAAMKAYCTLTPMDFRHSSPEALHTKRRERPLLAKDGTKAQRIYLAIRNSRNY